MTPLTELLDRHVREGALPGAVALIADDDEVDVAVVGARSFGGAPMTRNSIFRVASVTKPITAAVVMTLVDDGTIALDDPIATWLPELASPVVVRTPSAALDDVVPARRPITVRDLLTFRAGYGFPSDFSSPVIADADPVNPTFTVGWLDLRAGPQLRPDPGRCGLLAGALELDVIDVTKIARMLEQAHERAPASASAKVVDGPARFARDPDEFTAAPKNFISPTGPATR